MVRDNRSQFSKQLEKLSYQATKATGTSMAFMVALAVVLVWLITGPLFNFSDTWQLVINTGTTIITFLMVFLIQRAQNKDALAIHLKLNEIVAAMEGASNRLIDVEDLSEAEIDALRRCPPHSELPLRRHARSPSLDQRRSFPNRRGGRSPL